MQIRAGNRQDEAIIRTIIFQALEEHGIQSDLEGRDNDLRNVERNYFWYDGLCLVAENDGQVVGVLAAKRSQKDESTLLLTRLAVVPGVRKRGTARELVKTMLFFANNMEYKKVVICVPGLEQEKEFFAPSFLQKVGFDTQSNSWNLTSLEN